MSMMASQITSPTIVDLTVQWGTDQRKHQSSASLAFVREIDLWPAYSPHKRPVTRKMFPFDGVILEASAFRVKKWYGEHVYFVVSSKQIVVIQRMRSCWLSGLIGALDACGPRWNGHDTTDAINELVSPRGVLTRKWYKLVEITIVIVIHGNICKFD